MENIYESSRAYLLDGLREVKNECDEAIPHYEVELNNTQYMDLPPRTKDAIIDFYDRIIAMYQHLKVKIEAAETQRGKYDTYDTYRYFYNRFDGIKSSFQSEFEEIIRYVKLNMPFDGEDISYEMDILINPYYKKIFGDLHLLDKDYNPESVRQRAGKRNRNRNLERLVAKDKEAEAAFLKASLREEPPQRGLWNYAAKFAKECRGAFCSSPRAYARAAAAPLGSVPNTRRANTRRASSQPRQRPTRGGFRRTRKNMKRRGAK
jgi:hypothetical protein